MDFPGLIRTMPNWITSESLTKRELVTQEAVFRLWRVSYHGNSIVKNRVRKDFSGPLRRRADRSSAPNAASSGTGIRAAAVHPGGVQTELDRHVERSQIQRIIEQTNKQLASEGKAPFQLNGRRQMYVFRRKESGALLIRFSCGDSTAQANRTRD